MAGTNFVAKGTWLECVSAVSYAVTAVPAVAAGVLVDSLALTAFGLESTIQTLAAGLVFWRNLSHARREKEKRRKYFERSFLFFPGILFFLLALYVLNESGSRLFYREQSESGSSGIILSVLAFAITEVLAFLKLHAARRLGSGPFRAAARESVIRTCLPLTLFLGVWLPVSSGFWWADPAAAFLMLPFIVREGSKAIDGSKVGPARDKGKEKSP